MASCNSHLASRWNRSSSSLVHICILGATVTRDVFAAGLGAIHSSLTASPDTMRNPTPAGQAAVSFLLFPEDHLGQTALF